MAAGRVVVGHVNERVRSMVRESTGLELPIVEATGATLERVLRDMVADRAGARSLADAAPAFARELHDGRRSAEVLRPFLLGGDA